MSSLKLNLLQISFIVLQSLSGFRRYDNFLIFPYLFCSKFISDIVMAVSSSMATRERSSESARFEILSDQHR